MRRYWESLYGDLVRSLGTLNQDKNFNLIKRSRPGLEIFEDTTSLLDFLADKDVGPSEKDRKDLIYAELVCIHLRSSPGAAERAGWRFCALLEHTVAVQREGHPVPGLPQHHSPDVAGIGRIVWSRRESW